MASQILAVKMIPHLGVTRLATAPPGTLPSHLDFLRLLLHHQHYQMKGFKGIPSISCTIDSSTKRARCKEVGPLGSEVTKKWKKYSQNLVKILGNH